MPSPAWIRAIIGLVAAAMLGLSALTGDSIDQQGLRWIAGVASGVTLLLLAFDRWLWRWPMVRWFTELAGQRVIHGTWRGQIDYLTDGQGNRGSTAVYMAVYQTYSTVSIRCYFPRTQATSWSLTAALSKGEHRHELRYIFQQEAPAPDRDRNRPTQGACQLAIVGRPVQEVSGSYYSERGGKGTMAFDGHSNGVAGSVAHAERMRFRDLPGSVAGE